MQTSVHSGASMFYGPIACFTKRKIKSLAKEIKVSKAVTMFQPNYGTSQNHRTSEIKSYEGHLQVGFIQS